jgi:hypothetical protein
MSNVRWQQAAAATVLAVLFFLAGFFVGRQPHEGPRVPAQAQQAKPRLGQWTVTFKPPASVHVPEAQPILKFEFERSSSRALDVLPVTISNLSERPYLVSCRLYGYDSRGRRMSGQEDVFAIGRRERVLREVRLVPYAFGTIMRARSFALVVSVFEE